MSLEYTFMPAPGDTISCPACGAKGGQGGMVRVRGIMTDKQYNDRRCNKCGHKWTLGDSLELPFNIPNSRIAPTKPEIGTQVPLQPEAPVGVDYSHIDPDFVEEVPGIPF